MRLNTEPDHTPLQDVIAAAVYHVLPDHAVAHSVDDEDSAAVMVAGMQHRFTDERGILLAFMETGHLFACFESGGEYRHAADSPDDDPRAVIEYAEPQSMMRAILDIAQHYTDHGEPPTFSCPDCGGAS